MNKNTGTNSKSTGKILKSDTLRINNPSKHNTFQKRV